MKIYSPNEFVTRAIIWNGKEAGWQTSLATALDVTRRTVRRAAKEGPTAKLSRKCDELLGFSKIIPPDRFIRGMGDSGQQYIVHTHYPRMIARVERAPVPTLYDIFWFDEPPEDRSPLIEAALQKFV